MTAPDNVSPAQARAWAEARLAQGLPVSHLQLAASRLGDHAQAILAVANRRP